MGQIVERGEAKEANSAEKPPNASPPDGALPKALLLDSPVFEAHAPLAYHPERPERLKAGRAAVAQAAVEWERVTPREATDDELTRVHHPRYVEALSKMRGEEGHLDADTYVSKGSVATARTAAGGLIDLVDALISGPITKGFALVRPPGHHARPDQAMGFCLLNNVAVAAAHARSRGLSRILVLDWDVHHGNGTQEIFWRDPSVLYISTHQFPFYPGTGALDEQGEGDGKGFTVNIPLDAHGGDAVYRAAFERIILPVIESYAPELVLVSAGFDAGLRDPLAEMELSSAAFGWMARAIAAEADRSAKGRVAVVLEGGYDLVSIEAGLGATIAGTMRGDAVEIARDPDAEDVARAAAAAEKIWSSVA